MGKSTISEFYKLSVPERVDAVRARGWLSPEDCQALAEGSYLLSTRDADKMIENVIGVMGLPVGLGLNFVVNGKDYVVPAAVEEPSIIAALSSAAKLIRRSGGFRAHSTEAMLIGQIQVVEVPDPERARSAVLQQRDAILSLANSLHPRMVARGGGARDVEVNLHPSVTGARDMLVVHLLVDTRDAMGANLVNTMCEGVAPLIEKITGGRVFLRILSNLTDRSLVSAEVRIPVAHLAGRGYSGDEVRDGIIIASQFAAVDRYRAATHNKGIMNGVDAVAIATGNDWRAIEAGAHAYAARGDGYTSLSHWSKGEDGELVGRIELPLKVGIVGGSLESNPSVALNLRLLGVESARELAEVMGAVGLAQNFGALRALATDGIQKGHMTLHARSVAMTAGATPDIFDTVVEQLIECGDIKVWKAQEIIGRMREDTQPDEAGNVRADARPDATAHGHGKVILLGEHAVVYGRHALAAPLPLAVRARIEDCDEGIHLLIPRWGVEHRMERDHRRRQSFERPAGLILERLGLADRHMRMEVFPGIPRAQGLGSSAAVAVAIIRALDEHFRLGLSDAEVNDLAFQAEREAHGTPSGIDNTVASTGRMLLYHRTDDGPVIQHIDPPEPIPLVVAATGIESLTAKTVADVRDGWKRNRRLYERIFDDIDTLTLQGVEAVAAADFRQLGELMNLCHGLLNALQVSSPELEQLVQVARRCGASGAKLTGGGGGGSIVAVCPQGTAGVAAGIRAAGYEVMEVELGVDSR